MVDLAEVRGRTHEVAAALHEAKTVLERVENVLTERAVDQALTRRLADVSSVGRSSERVSQAEQEAGPKRRVAWQTQDPRAIAESERADAALGSAFKASQDEAGNISPNLTEPLKDLAGLRDDLRGSSEQLQNAMKHADALDHMTEYGGPKDQLANVRGVKAIVDTAEKGVAEAVARIETARTVVSRFANDPPAIKSGLLADEVTSTANSLRKELGTAQGNVRDVLGAVAKTKKDVGKATDQAIGAAVTAKDAEKADAALAKNVQAGTTPRPASGQHAEGSQPTLTESQQNLHRRLGGQAQGNGLQL